MLHRPVETAANSGHLCLYSDLKYHLLWPQISVGAAMID